MMKKNLVATLALSLGLFAGAASAQDKTAQKEAAATPTPAASSTPVAPAITATTAPLDLARAAYNAMGGDKLRAVKNVVLIGTVDLYPPNSSQSIPGKFALVTAGEKARVEIQSPGVNFRQIYDGQTNYSSVPNVQLPPPTKFGLDQLKYFDQTGFTVTALPDKKKQRAFRIADAAGNTTDFYIDTATGRVMTYLIPYNGLTFGVEHKTFKEIDGVLLPMTFTQRLETPQGAFFAEYKVKDAKINQALGDDVFTIPN